MRTAPPNSGAAERNKEGAEPQFLFLMNVETAKPFTAGYDFPQVAIDMAVKYVGEVFPKTKPTASGRGTVFDTPEFKAMQEKMALQWDIAKADAKAMQGVTAKQVQSFKARHNISPDKPLSPDARQLLREEMEADDRSKSGNERAIANRLMAIRNRLELQPGLGQLICDQCRTVEADRYVATDYLLRLLPDIGMKPYRKLCQGLWDALPDMTKADRLAVALSEVPARRALFWGVILRLDQLKGNPPTTGGPFLEWCQFQTYKKHASRIDSVGWSLGDALAERMQKKEARGILRFPIGVELTTKEINDAFKSLAKQHHPDAGGDPAKFKRINEAKERLMLEVGA